jgi:hypothetical protein
MAARVAPVKKRGRGGIRLLIVLAVLVLLIGGLVVGLNLAAQAATNVGATLTVFVPTVSVARNGGTYEPAISGTIVQPGDSVKTDAKGRGQIRLPDGSNMRLAGGAEIKLTAAHFGKDGHLHDVSILQKIGRTLSSVQHLAGGATFQVVGNTTTASVRGTLFEVGVNSDGSVLIKLFEGQLDVDGKTHVHLNANQQVTIDPSGNVGTPGPVTPDPNDPFSSEMVARQQASDGTTPGTEQDFVGPPLHNGEAQLYSYSFAGGSDIKAALAYPGSLMELKITGPDTHVYDKTGPSPVIITIPDPPPGIYKLNVIGKSGLDPAGEAPYLSVAATEPCATANIEQNGAVRHAYTAKDLANAVSVSGLSNLQVNIVGDSTGGAILQGSATYNGVSLSGTLLLYTHGGNIGIVPLAATAFGVNLPAQQATQQIASALGSDPSNVSLGYHVDRLFTCSSVLMIDGRTPGQ